MFDELKTLGGTATLHRMAGHVATGGHQMTVFEPAEEIECIIRPWQSDIGEQMDSGYSGQTPGFKVFVAEGIDLDRGDRLLYRGEPIRLSNPHYDQFTDLERWDGRDDERQFREAADYDDADIVPSDEGPGDL